MRYFVVPQRIQQKTIQFTEEQMHHMRKVLRLKAGDKVECFDDKGNLYTVSIKKLSKDASFGTVVNIERIIEHDPNRPKLTILEAFPASLPKLDLVIEKCTELGADAFIFYKSIRSELHVLPSEDKVARWKKILVKASEQSRRNTVPELYVVNTIENLDFSLYDCKVVLYEKSEVADWPASLSSAKNTLIVIGPEGGFEKKEIEYFREQGFMDIKPFKNILRTETAPIAATAIIKDKI